MATLVYIVGKSGRGKSASCMNLDPDSSVIINTDANELPFPKANEKFNSDRGNYLETSDIKQVKDKLAEVHKNEKVKTVVIDTWSRIMTDAIMSKSFRHASNGMQAWANMAYENYDLINTINQKLRSDVIVYMMCHPTTVYDESGFPQEQIAVQGKQLEKFVPESFSSIVLYAQTVKDPGKPAEYYFRTSSSGEDTCKTPMGMFTDTLIPNDLTIISEAINAYKS